ncbi:MAG: hypothetical protein R3D00_20485 [Bacteroidia bacterium]
MRKLLLILLLLMGHIYAQDTVKTIHFNGYKTKVEWANKSNRLACLVRADEQSMLYFVDPVRAGILRELKLPAEMYFTTFTWSTDDKGIILSSWDQENFETNAYYLNITRGIITDTLPHLGAYMQVDDMVGHEGFLAVSSSGEGHPDISVYKWGNYEELFNTEVYPGGISLNGWCKGKLYVASDIRLEWGLSREERLKYMEKTGLVKDIETADLFAYLTEDWRVYAIDPKTRKAKVSGFPAGCGVYSYDGKYSFTSTLDAEGLLEFDLTLLKR